MSVAETPPPDDRDDETQARHVATRAELLPEEKAVGSDNPQAQEAALRGGLIGSPPSVAAAVATDPAQPLTRRM